MSRNTRRLWTLNHALLSALVLFLFHALILKLYRDAPSSLAAWLLLAFFLVVVNREIAVLRVELELPHTATKSIALFVMRFVREPTSGHGSPRK